MQFIRLLYSLGNILAIVPPYSFSTKCDAKSKVLYKFYTAFVFLIMITGSGLAIFGRFKDAYPTLPSATLIVTDSAVLLSTAVTNIFAILVPSLWRLEDFKIFFRLFAKTDHWLLKDQSVTKKYKAFYIKLLIGHLALLVIFTLDAYVWMTELGFTRFRHYIFRDLQSYHLFITSMTMYNFVLLLEYRFAVVNNNLKRLDNSVPAYKDSGTEIQVKMFTCESHQAVREISLMYETQIKQIILFNKIFGWQILFMTLCTMMGLLYSWDLLTVFIFTGQTESSGVAFGYELIILSCLWALWQLAVGAIVVVGCSKAERTAKETADICFNMLLKLPVISEKPHDKALRDELFLLSQLVINRYPSFSAAGFFSVNRSLLLSICGSVTTYVIVLIQFQ